MMNLMNDIKAYWLISIRLCMLYSFFGCECRVYSIVIK